MGKAVVRGQRSEVRGPGDATTSRRRFLAGAMVAVAAAGLPVKVRAKAVQEPGKCGRIRTRPLNRAELFEDHNLAG